MSFQPDEQILNIKDEETVKNEENITDEEKNKCCGIKCEGFIKSRI